MDRSTRSPSPAEGPKKRSKWNDSDEPEGSPSNVPAIKRRLVRPKKLRRQDEAAEAALSTPGAGPSSPPRKTTTPPPSPPGMSRSPVPPVISPAPAKRGPPPRSHLTPSRAAHPPLMSCRSVYNYTRLNHIEEGTYGVVFRARCNDTGGIFALKKLKLEEEKQGFPITSLREVMALMVAGEHENVVGIREIVVGDTLNQ